MDEAEVGWLLRSYVRRKQFEADILAAALARTFGGEPSPATPTASPTTARVTPRQFMKIVQGGDPLA